MKLIRNLIITLKTKGFKDTFFAIKSFFAILFINFFSSNALLKRRIFNYYMYLDPKDRGISRTLLLFGERELDHKLIFERIVKKNMKIFDIGANIGYYVLMESNLIGEKGKILAIEPVDKNIKLLRKNLKLNNNKITKTVQIAISNDNKKNKRNFLISTHSNLGHLVSDQESRLIKKRAVNKEEIKFIRTKTMNIKTLIKKNFIPDFIRMDIEGSEAEIIGSLAKLNLKKYPIICFETHTSKYKNSNKMRDSLKQIFKKGYRVKFVSTSYKEASTKLNKLGYRPYYRNIKTDDVIRDIYKDLKKEHAINLICNKGGLRTILMVYEK